MHADVFAMAAEFISQEMLVDRGTGADFRRRGGRRSRVRTIATALARGEALPSGTHATDFAKVTRILDESVREYTFRSPHGPFSRLHPCRDDRQRARGDRRSGRVANLLNRIALGQAEAGGMPKERPRIPPERVAYVRDWIARGAPDSDPPGIGVTGEPVPPREPAGSWRRCADRAPDQRLMKDFRFSISLPADLPRFLTSTCACPGPERDVRILAFDLRTSVLRLRRGMAFTVELSRCANCNSITSPSHALASLCSS